MSGAIFGYVNTRYKVTDGCARSLRSNKMDGHFKFGCKIVDVGYSTAGSRNRARICKSLGTARDTFGLGVIFENVGQIVCDALQQQPLAVGCSRTLAH